MRKTQVEAKKAWIEMQERGLFMSFGINDLPFDQFEEISQCFGVGVLNNGNEVTIPIISPEMVHHFYGCYMQPGDYKYERELKSLDRFAHLGPSKEQLVRAQKIFAELLPEIDDA